MSTAKVSGSLPSVFTPSLPTITVFSHPAARLIKTVPQLQPPARVNGHVPIDTLGLGRTPPTDVVLTDVYGPLSLLLVPDPFDPSIATLVLSVGFPDTGKLQGASRRFVLPFRSLQRDPVTGQLLSRSQISGFDAADRKLYPGLGAGLKGIDGGSFWFFEDVGEEGAFDRYRWERDGVGRRAIWSVWLISTPSVVVQHLQNLLQAYPAPVPPLPPWLKERNGYPWQDSYLALNQAATAEQVPGQAEYSNTAMVDQEPPRDPGPSPTARRPLPLIPQLPSEPENQHPDSKDTDKGHEAETIPTATEVSDHDASTSPAATPAASRLITGDLSRSIALSEYRNSLVAVDNLTGRITGVLATNINLDQNEASDQPFEELTDSSDELGADADEEQEAQTPLDEHTRILQHKGDDHALSPVLSEAPALPDSIIDEKELPTPRPSTIVYRAASVYRDAPAEGDSNRPPSVLADNTFSPPPLPPKQTARRDEPLHHQLTADATPSRRTSTASAAFFSAESDAEAMSSYDSDALEIDPRNIAHDKLPSVISVRGKATNDVEKHRPELLRDPLADDDADSDASGSTVGGPAVRIWRKAIGKGKKKKKSSNTDPLAARDVPPRPLPKSRQASEVSVRTSRAETALEALPDDNAVNQNETPAPATATEDDVTPPPTLKSGSRNHLPRAGMRTDQVRAVEDQIWREAIDNGHLPIDAPYTHLAARGDLYSSSILSSPRSIADGSAIELLSTEEAGRKAQKAKRNQQQRAERMRQMQGGTVLIEFLAGSSRIGASIIRGAGLGANGEDGVRDSEASTKTRDLASNIWSYVPVLPQHLLSFFGLSSSFGASDPVAANPEQSAYTSYLPTFGLPTMGGWFSNLFSLGVFTSTVPSVTESAEAEAPGDPSKAEEWEYAIPDFDPNSLASTPRPVYRRKRPVPSAANGFAISAATPAATDALKTSKNGVDVERGQQRIEGLPAQTENRYSILHIDSLGVGRRAFLRGMPDLDVHRF